MKSLIRKIFERICSGFRRKRILYVGVAEYSDDIKILEANNDVTSIDLVKTKFGAKKHFVKSITDANFPDDYFDVIFMLGVVGYGLDEPEKILKAFENVRRMLKPNGSVIFTMTKRTTAK